MDPKTPSSFFCSARGLLKCMAAFSACPASLPPWAMQQERGERGAKIILNPMASHPFKNKNVQGIHRYRYRYIYIYIHVIIYVNPFVLSESNPSGPNFVQVLGRSRQSPQGVFFRKSERRNVGNKIQGTKRGFDKQFQFGWLFVVSTSPLYEQNW